jgi:hypothetical protein
LVNSRLGLLTAASSGSGRRAALTLPRRPFSRSYGAILPSSLTRGLPSTLVCSTCRPVSVCGTGRTRLHTRLFSAVRAQPTWSNDLTITPHPKATRLDGSRRWAYPPASPACSNVVPWYRNLDRLSIAYGSRPRLRPDSPAADDHRCGTLRHSVGGVRTLLALLIPAFALVAPPGRVPPPLLRDDDAPLP